MEGTAVNVPAMQRTCANKRAASQVDEARNVKRVKDLFEETVRAAEQPVPPQEPTRTKRPLDDDECMLVGERSAADAAAAAAARAPVRRGVNGGATGGEVQRVLRASDLENSIASISSALRWRSPAKPYKLARIHGPYSPPRPTTAVRGIVDVGAEADEDDPGQPGKQSDGQPQLDPGAMGHSGPATRGQQAPGWDGSRSGQSAQPQPSFPPPLARLHQQQQEWGRLFSALSLGGGRGSQRSDPVWAAVSSNRAAGGVVARRCDAQTDQQPDPLFRPLPGAPRGPFARRSRFRDAVGALQRWHRHPAERQEAADAAFARRDEATAAPNQRVGTTDTSTRSCAADGHQQACGGIEVPRSGDGAPQQVFAQGRGWPEGPAAHRGQEAGRTPDYAVQALQHQRPAQVGLGPKERVTTAVQSSASNGQQRPQQPPQPPGLAAGPRPHTHDACGGVSAASGAWSEPEAKGPPATATGCGVWAGAAAPAHGAAATTTTTHGFGVDAGGSSGAGTLAESLAGAAAGGAAPHCQRLRQATSGTERGPEWGHPQRYALQSGSRALHGQGQVRGQMAATFAHPGAAGGVPAGRPQRGAQEGCELGDEGGDVVLVEGGDGAASRPPQPQRPPQPTLQFGSGSSGAARPHGGAEVYGEEEDDDDDDVQVVAIAAAAAGPPPPGAAALRSQPRQTAQAQGLATRPRPSPQPQPQLPPSQPGSQRLLRLSSQRGGGRKAATSPSADAAPGAATRAGQGPGANAAGGRLRVRAGGLDAGAPSQPPAGGAARPPPAAPTVAPAMARDAKCPICGAPFLARMSNAEVNAHVDACVAALS